MNDQIPLALARSSRLVHRQRFVGGVADRGRRDQLPRRRRPGSRQIVRRLRGGAEGAGLTGVRVLQNGPNATGRAWRVNVDGPASGFVPPWDVARICADVQATHRTTRRPAARTTTMSAELRQPSGARRCQAQRIVDNGRGHSPPGTHVQSPPRPMSDARRHTEPPSTRVVLEALQGRRPPDAGAPARIVGVARWVLSGASSARACELWRRRGPAVATPRTRTIRRAAVSAAAAAAGPDLGAQPRVRGAAR